MHMTVQMTLDLCHHFETSTDRIEFFMKILETVNSLGVCKKAELSDNCSRTSLFFYEKEPDND